MADAFSIATEYRNEENTTLAPITGEFKVRSFDTKYHTEIQGRRSDRLAVFTVGADESRGFAESPQEYLGLYLPLDGCFSTDDNKRTFSFARDIHLLRPDREFLNALNSSCRILATNIYAEPLQAHLHKLTGSDVSKFPELGNRIEMSSAAGLMLARNIIRLWTELNSGGAGSGSSIGIMELEEELIASFVMTTEKASDSHRRTQPVAVQRAMTRAEEFLNANLLNAVSRSDLADFVGVSIRTLSRAFLKRHGMGPMGFLRARRLDIAYRHLLAAEAGSTKVTDVAVRYGFNHLGKFAMEYKKVFGESPSVTLNRRRFKGLLSILSKHFKCSKMR